MINITPVEVEQYIRKVESISSLTNSNMLPEKEKKTSWTDGEKFKMMFEKEMREYENNY